MNNNNGDDDVRVREKYRQKHMQYKQYYYFYYRLDRHKMLRSKHQNRKVCVCLAQFCAILSTCRERNLRVFRKFSIISQKPDWHQDGDLLQSPRIALLSNSSILS